MTYKLLYIDDDPNAKIIVDGFNTSGLISVEYIKPTNFEEQIKELVAADGQYNGLILDLKLDENLSTERKAYYSATTLAQQIRTKVSEGEWKSEIPMILFTTQQKMNAAFSGDFYSENLFDIAFTKDNISHQDLQLKIASIIEAYDLIKRSKPDIPKILGISDLEQLDKRTFPAQLILGEGTSVYSYANYILNNLIMKPGPLIDEFYLAARLGVDRARSGDQWDIVKKTVTECAGYKGVYSNAWERWWMFMINIWWEENFKGHSLASLDARDRIEKLNEKFGLKLTVAEPIPKAASYRYWTVCQGYDSPLDPREGLIINEKTPLPWQENKYISIEAAMERVRRNEGLKINPSEKERFEILKKTFKSNGDPK